MRISDWSSDVCSSDLFAPQRASDEPGAGGAAHAVGEYGDLASALDGMHVLVQQVVAIPGREVHRLDADLAGRHAAQLVVVAEVGVPDPLPPAGAAFAAQGQRGGAARAPRGGGGQRVTRAEVAGGGP